MEVSEVRRLAKRIIFDLCSVVAETKSVNDPKGTVRRTRAAKRRVAEVTPHVVTFHLVIEPRMTGLLLISDPPTTEHLRFRLRLSPSPRQTEKAARSEEERRPATIQFWDRRGLGTIQLLTPDEMNQLASEIGPDPLTMDAAAWKDRLTRTRREIKPALLDQSLVAGIGNLYASEILHRAGISPFHSCADVSAAKITRLAESAKFILSEAIRYEGSTLGDGTYRNALNRDGSYQNHHQVYQRADKTCPACGKGIIERVVQAQRSTFFCPRCQK